MVWSGGEGDDLEGVVGRCYWYESIYCISPASSANSVVGSVLVVIVAGCWVLKCICKALSMYIYVYVHM